MCSYIEGTANVLIMNTFVSTVLQIKYIHKFVRSVFLVLCVRTDFIIVSFTTQKIAILVYSFCGLWHGGTSE